jgi:hypothetical protein
VAVLAALAGVVAAREVHPAAPRAAVPAQGHAGVLAQEPVQEPAAVRRPNRGPAVRRPNRGPAVPAVALQRVQANAAPQARARNQRRRSPLRAARAPLLARVLAPGKKPLRQVKRQQVKRQQVRRSRTGQALARAQVPVSAAARVRASVREPAQVNVPEPVQAQLAADALRT